LQFVFTEWSEPAEDRSRTESGLRPLMTV